MTVFAKHKKISVTLLGALLAMSILSTDQAIAQLTNGVFDPSKVRIAKEKAKQVQSYQQNIASANHYNKTLNTPDHPRPYKPLFDDMDRLHEKTKLMEQQMAQMALQIQQMNSTPAPAPQQRISNVPQFRRVKKAGPQPFVKVTRKDDQTPPPPTISAPGSDYPEAGFESPNTAPVLETTEIDAGGPAFDLPSEGNTRGGLFSNLFRSRSSNAGSIPTIDGDPNRIAELESKIAELENTVQVLRGVESNLPPGVSLPKPGHGLPGIGQTSNRFKGLFNRKRPLDTPAQPIPINIGRGNPFYDPDYNDPNFEAGPQFSSIFDIHPKPEEIKDMTDPTSLPIPGDNAPPPSAPEVTNSEVSKYHLVTREGSLFTPFKQGTTSPDAQAAYELYESAVVKVIGASGSNHKVEVDSGETGLLSKSAVRPLTGSEKTVMKKGLSAGKLWYSILDSEPIL